MNFVYFIITESIKLLIGLRMQRVCFIYSSNSFFQRRLVSLCMHKIICLFAFFPICVFRYFCFVVLTRIGRKKGDILLCIVQQEKQKGIVLRSIRRRRRRQWHSCTCVAHSSRTPVERSFFILSQTNFSSS